MKDLRTLLIGAVAASLFAACAGAPAAPAAGDVEIPRQVAISRSVLKDAVTTAKAYGQAHLGHFLDLDVKELRRKGLKLPSSISLKVGVTHTSFCIVAINEALPSIHPWARGSVSSRDERPSNQDRCGR